MQAENSPSRKQLIVQYAIGMIVGIVLGLISAYFIRQYYFKPSVPSIEIAYPQDIPYDKENAETLSSIHTSAAIIQESYFRGLTTEELLNGAVLGINFVLEKNKLESLDLEPILPDAPLTKQVLEATAKASASPSAEKSPAAESGKDQPKDSKPADAPSPAESTATPAAATPAASPADSTATPAASPSSTPQAKPGQVSQNDKAIYEDFDDKYLHLLNKCKGKVKAEDIMYGAIYGICAATGDYYTTALTAEEYARMKESMGDDNYGGVGIYIEADRKNDNRLTVIEPIEGGPSERAGIKAADYIYEIDGKPTDSIDLETCSQMMRGPKGTSVTLGIKRGEETLTFKIIREDIHVKSTQLKELGDGVAYIRVRFFGPETGKEFKIKRMEAESRGAKCLIIDLRNNGGGYVVTAGEMVSEFLPKGSLITNLVNPHVGTDEDFRVNISDDSKIPLVVLINRFSASASELAAGCLQDHKRAVIVGETSFGKGSVQRIFDLPNGGALKFTIAHYLTPNHKDIHMKGITPDIICEDEPTNKLGGPNDKQLQEAIKAVPKAEKLQAEYSASSSSPAP